jgi:hypothetical protein
MVSLERLAVMILREIIPLVDLSELGVKKDARKILEDLKREYPELKVEPVLSQLEELEEKKRAGEAYEKLC